MYTLYRNKIDLLAPLAWVLNLEYLLVSRSSLRILLKLLLMLGLRSFQIPWFIFTPRVLVVIFLIFLSRCILVFSVTQLTFSYILVTFTSRLSSTFSGPWFIISCASMFPFRSTWVLIPSIVRLWWSSFRFLRIKILLIPKRSLLCLCWTYWFFCPAFFVFTTWNFG